MKKFLTGDNQGIMKQSEPARLWRIRWQFAGLLALLLLLLLADYLCYQQALPVELDFQGGNATLHVGSESVAPGTIGVPISLQLAPHDPVVHEYQIDGSDSTNNFTLDTTYLRSIASSPYYRFQAWMRDLDGTSRWSNLRVYSAGRLLTSQDWPADGATVPLGSAVRSGGTAQVRLLLRRPETPMTLNLLMADHSLIQITLDRNDRKIEITHNVAGQSNTISNTFFPVDVLPFAAMVLDTLVRTLLWAVLALLAVLSCEILIVVIGRGWVSLTRSQANVTALEAAHAAQANHASRVDGTWLARIWRRLTGALHPVALLALLGSFCFVAWIAKVQYHAEPHIYDASAYLFAARMYAIGRLSVPLPPAASHFPGPFMVQVGGQWFGQYPPGTALTLVPGIWLGVPWLVEPLLGTVALLGIGLIAARLYDRRVATLTVLLGVLSPFYSYLAASYLSHTVALFYLVWGVWLLLRFLQDGARWNLPCAAFLFGMASLARDLVAVLFVATVVVGLAILFWQRFHVTRERLIAPALASLAVVLGFIGLSLGFNALLTHNPLVTPRSLFFAGDHWGFGQGIGFYGQHTLAAGLVNLDEQLTILAIDLYGWPFYLTLAFALLPFLTRRARGSDWFCLVSALILICAYVGYFYHGIYLGPRYLFESLPFLLMLTARGILTLAAAGQEAARTIRERWQPQASRQRTGMSIPTFALVTLLVLCNLLYYMPRQIELYRNYSGLPQWYHLNLDEVYHPPVHHAIVVTNDYTVYQLVLFPLNDPLFQGDVIYAWSDNAAGYTELQNAYPQRTLYRLDIAADGSVRYTPISGTSRSP